MNGTNKQNMVGLAKDTAIYGLSTVLTKFLNYLLLPLCTHIFDKTAEYGTVTKFYAWTALLIVVLTYGMETGFFRFISQEESPQSVYKTSYFTLLLSSTIFAGACLALQQPISACLGYADHCEYVAMMAVVVAMDASSSIPFAYLRYQKCSILFCLIKQLYVILSLGLNILFLLVLRWQDIKYVFLSNVLASSIQTICLVGFTLPHGGKYSLKILTKMLKYSFPLLLMGIAGIMNQTLDRLLFTSLYPGTDGEAQLGIYGACFKVAMVMLVFTQAFRFAYEPLIFAKHKEKNNLGIYADAMKYYIIFAYLILLGVIFYLDLLKYIIGRSYWEGLKIVPIVLWTYVFQGIYFNLGIWYKLTDKTKWGAYLSIIGLAITLVLQIWGVPRFGYWASCGSGLICFFILMIISYFCEHKHMHIPYDLKNMGLYTLLTLLLLGIYYMIQVLTGWIDWRMMGVGTILLGVFIAVMCKKDVPISAIFHATEAVCRSKNNKW